MLLKLLSSTYYNNSFDSSPSKIISYVKGTTLNLEVKFCFIFLLFRRALPDLYGESGLGILGELALGRLNCVLVEF